MISRYSTNIPLYVSKSFLSVPPVFRNLLARVRCVGEGSNLGSVVGLLLIMSKVLSISEPVSTSTSEK